MEDKRYRKTLGMKLASPIEDQYNRYGAEFSEIVLSLPPASETRGTCDTMHLFDEFEVGRRAPTKRYLSFILPRHANPIKLGERKHALLSL